MGKNEELGRKIRCFKEIQEKRENFRNRKGGNPHKLEEISPARRLSIEVAGGRRLNNSSGYQSSGKGGGYSEKGKNDPFRVPKAGADHSPGYLQLKGGRWYLRRREL